MTYIVTENCINCKFQDCVTVCPVDCFYEGENFLVIHPDECIDCGVCEPECPADAIKPDTESGLDEWLAVNTKYAEIWPNITEVGNVPPDAEEWNGKLGKASLLITGEEPEKPSSQKPAHAPEDGQHQIPGKTYEVDGARIAIEDVPKSERIKLEPRAPVKQDGAEIEGLLIKPEDEKS